MAIGISTSATTVTISGGITLGANNIIVKYLETHAGSFQTIYTATSGKTFYLMGYIICSSAAQLVAHSLADTDGSTVVSSVLMNSATVPIQQLAVSFATVGGKPYTNAQPIKVKGDSNASNGYFTIWGYEV